MKIILEIMMNIQEYFKINLLKIVLIKEKWMKENILNIYNIFPLIIKFIEEFNNKNEENKSLYFNNDYNISDFNFVIEEIDLIRDGQKMKLWKFIELSTP